MYISAKKFVLSDIEVTGRSFDNTSIQITASDTWTSDATTGGYKHTYSMSNVFSASTPMIGPDYGGKTSAQISSIDSFWSDVFKAETADGSITIYKTTSTAAPLSFYLAIEGY